MPNNDFIPNILEMEDLIITNVESDNAESKRQIRRWMVTPK